MPDLLFLLTLGALPEFFCYLHLLCFHIQPLHHLQFWFILSQRKRHPLSGALIVSS
uniref:Uncharacterized protein n=1 Tax=Siphoviridae sp. ct8rU2 TaxID=2825366 RepID=A0A8S5UW60_9CAUD|nr:MAG TPA: hypothetical protein [Siphoviridae sp. ct8rU2]